MSDIISIAFETNGKGYLGYILEFPGAFIRGRTIDEALSKVEQEIRTYQRWRGVQSKLKSKTKIVQIHQSTLMIEDADSEILLDMDKEKMEEKEFNEYIELIKKSGISTLSIYQNAKFKNWLDEARRGKTFYGDVPISIQRIFEHIDSVQYFYLSRISTDIEKKEGFLEGREHCLNQVRSIYMRENNSKIYNCDHENWTIRKVLRRFIWHDRIHAKSMVKILKKQKMIGLIDFYEDPFYFFDS